MTPDVIEKKWRCHDNLAVTVNDAAPWHRSADLNMTENFQISQHPSHESSHKSEQVFICIGAKSECHVATRSENSESHVANRSDFIYENAKSFSIGNVLVFQGVLFDEALNAAIFSLGPGNLKRKISALVIQKATLLNGHSVNRHLMIGGEIHQLKTLLY